MKLTPEQGQEVQVAGEEPVRVIDPQTHQEYVLLPVELFRRVQDLLYDASPWTDEEMEMLAAEDVDSLGWEGMEAYQDES